MQPPTAVILAGGLGTRIKHLLDGRPKPLAEVAGKPFLEWLIRYLARQGIEKFIVSAGYRADMIAEFCATLALPNVRIRSVAEDSPQGTAGGFLQAVAGDQSKSWLVCNGDSLVCANLASFLSLHESDPEDGRLLALHVEDSSRYGNLRVDEQGYLAAFNEKVAGTGLINAGVYLLRARVLEHSSTKRPLSFETDLFPALLREGKRIRVDKVTAPFIDIGTESSLQEAEAFITRIKNIEM
jgi:D-glycero-alpha-D-manno-heptose 1-phosphate guanylyltransferase